MPRINVDENWWTDPRRTLLIAKIGILADSVMLQAWRVSQDYWKHDKQPVPKKVFHSIPHAKEIIECILAEETDQGVYVCGSSSRHDWLCKRLHNAKKGGEANRKQNEANPEQTRPSSSSSFSKRKNTTRSNGSSTRSSAILKTPPEWFLRLLSPKFEEKLVEVYGDAAWVEHQLSQMEVWFLGNPSRRPKSRSGASRFVLSWLNKSKADKMNNGGVPPLEIKDWSTL
jgi:hypothetical protein